MRGFKIAHGDLAHDIRAALQRVAKLEAARAAMPLRVPVGDIVEGEVVRLAPERKLLTNLIKMVAYQAESDLVRLVAPHYKRVDDEGRTLIQSALASSADLVVTETELRVVLAPLSSPHRTRRAGSGAIPRSTPSHRYAAISESRLSPRTTSRLIESVLQTSRVDGTGKPPAS